MPTYKTFVHFAPEDSHIVLAIRIFGVRKLSGLLGISGAHLSRVMNQKGGLDLEVYNPMMKILNESVLRDYNHETSESESS